MESINEKLKSINEISKIPFKISDELGDIYISPSFVLSDLFVEEEFYCYDDKYIISVNNKYESALPLLIYNIKDSIYNIKNSKGDIITKLINGINVEENIIKNTIPLLMHKFYIITVYVENEKNDAYELINECYNDKDILIVKEKENIYVIGILNEVYEHAISIKETLSSIISGKILISYTKVNAYKDIMNAIKRMKSKINISLKYNTNVEILSDKELLFEEIIDNIDSSKKKEIMEEYNSGIKKINNEMIKTIEVFFKNGLNVSESAKELFVHRNTLIYRLDKIQKYLGFDIRNFNEAIIFKILLTILKEKSVTVTKY